jgi:hypothetical protein
MELEALDRSPFEQSSLEFGWIDREAAIWLIIR